MHLSRVARTEGGTGWLGFGSVSARARGAGKWLSQATLAPVVGVLQNRCYECAAQARRPSVRGAQNRNRDAVTLAQILYKPRL